MATYKLELDPIANPKEKLTEQHESFIGIMMTALMSMVNLVDGVTHVELGANHTLIIYGDDSLESELLKFHKQAIITKLS